MPFNGSGVYSAPSLPGSWNPAISGQDATPDDWNTLLADLSTALSTMITRNGESTVTQDIPMSGYKFTGVGNAAARTQYASMGQIQDGGGVYAAAGGTANALTITLSPAITAYAVGQRFRIKQGASANTTAVTLDINSIGAGDVKWPDGTALGADAIPANAMFDVEVADISTPTAPIFHLQTVASPFQSSGDTMTGTLTMSGAAINEAVRVDVASATTCDIGAAASNYVRITGTTTITGLGTIASGVRRKVVFAGILTLTHNATSLILPTGQNITTAAGDCAEFESEGSGNWRCTEYLRANGSPVSQNRAYAEYTTYATLSGTIPTDNTIPQVGEGNEILSVAITPKSTSSRVRVLVQVPMGLGSGGSPDNACAALFRNGGTDAIASTFIRLVDGSSCYPAVINFEDVPASTSAQTYTVRVGANSASVNVNGVAAGRLGGGSSRASIILEEIPQ